jgi:hypothetical protein
MTEPTQNEMAENIIALMQNINGRLADRRTNQMFGIPTAKISEELELKLGSLSDGFGELADSLEQGG